MQCSSRVLGRIAFSVVCGKIPKPKIGLLEPISQTPGSCTRVVRSSADHSTGLHKAWFQPKLFLLSSSQLASIALFRAYSVAQLATQLATTRHLAAQIANRLGLTDERVVVDCFASRALCHEDWIDYFRRGVLCCTKSSSVFLPQQSRGFA